MCPPCSGYREARDVVGGEVGRRERRKKNGERKIQIRSETNHFIIPYRLLQRSEREGRVGLDIWIVALGEKKMAVLLLLEIRSCFF